MSAPTALPGALHREFESITGPAGCLTAPADLAPYLTEWRGHYRGQAAAVLLPASTAEAAALVAACARHGVGIVPQGGNTGLVGGAVARSTPERPQVVVATRRLARIRALDPDNYTLTAEAGCVLADLQAAAAAADRLFPLSLGAEGSCQLGGNLSSNAGGINVLRYGNARDLVLGLEVVLADGRVLDGLRALRKDNTGYDLKQLFIGAEGTLGLITAATCKLFPRPASIATAFVAVADPRAAIALHGRARACLGDRLAAFELVGRVALELVLRHVPGSRDPLGVPSPWYVLLELGSARPDAAAELEEFLGAALEAGRVVDGALAHSEAQRSGFWQLRHHIAEAEKRAGAGLKHDVSVPVSRVDTFIERATAELEARVPGAVVVVFGHLGDGNLHFNLQAPPHGSETDFLARRTEVAEAVHELVAALGGSFSAEHGVGLLKRAELRRYRGGVELDLMRRIKAALDPAGLMNPGKLFDADR